MKVFYILSILVLSTTHVFAVPVAKINGSEINSQDLSAMVSHLNEFQKQDLLSNKGTKEKILNEIVDLEVLAQESKKSKLHEKDEFKAAVKLFERQYLANQALEKFFQGKVTEEAQQAYYEKYKVRFSTSQVRTQSIVVKNEKTANEIISQAQKKGSNFGVLAEKYSEDSSVKINRGDMGYMTRDKLPLELGEAVFQSSKGAIVGPIQTDVGYYVVKVIDRKPGSTLPYGDVKLTVKNLLEKDLKKQFLNELKANSKIEIKL